MAPNHMDIFLLAIIVSVLSVTGGYSAYITVKYGWTTWIFRRMTARETEAFGILIVLTVMAVATLLMRVYVG